MSIGLGINCGLRSGLVGLTNPVVSGLLAHWDFGLAGNLRGAADGSGAAVADTGEVKWARDQSPNANHLTVATANGPTWQANLFNGRGAIRFTSAQALGSIAALGNGASEFTMFLIGTGGSGAGLGNIVVAGVTSFTVPGSNWFGISDVSGVYKIEGSGSVIDYATSVSFDTRLRVSSNAYSNSVSHLIRFDGATIVDAPGAAYSLANGPCYIGGWNAPTNAISADICAVLIYDRALTLAECEAVELYLANQYGVNITGMSWPASYSIIQQASVYAGTLNANQLGTSADPLKYHFDGENIDELGTNNASLTDGATQATWANLGVTTGDATQATDANRPTLQKNVASSQDAVTFGGNADSVTIASSAAGLSFIHNTNDWDIFVVGRKDLASRQVVLSNTDLEAEKGFVLDFDSAGKAHFKINNAVPGNTAEITWPDAQAVGELFAVEVYGAAGSTAMRIDGLTGADTNGTLATGDATNTTVIGCLASTAVGSLDGALFLILIFNKRVPGPQQDALFDYFASRFGL